MDLLVDAKWRLLASLGWRLLPAAQEVRLGPVCGLAARLGPAHAAETSAAYASA